MALTDLAAGDDLPGIVLVTHHLEEVPPGWTHALLLRDGPVSQAFGLPLRVRRDDGRYVARAGR